MSLISYSNIQDGTTVDAADVNNPLNIIVNDYNGNIDSNNIADNSIIAGKINNGAVTEAKIADGAVTAAKLVSKLTAIVTAATITPSSQIYVVTAQAENATIAIPSFTATDGMSLIIRIKDSGSARTLTWNGIYRAVGVTIPPATVASKEHYIGCVYNAGANKWDVVAIAREA